MNNMQRPSIAKITRVIDEAEGIKSIFIEGKINAKPGQFVMLWIPRVDEKPFALGYLDKEEFGITVAAVGPFSNRLCSMQEGDKIGIRGPYGTSYSLKGKKVIMVGGGYGSASLALLAEEALDKGIEVIFINGARTKNRLIYGNRFFDLKVETHMVTDDGTSGIKGRATDVLEKVLSEHKADKVFSCGPEIMLKKVSEICVSKNIACEISVERYFKCGFGLCGHCCVDPLGIRVCVEGPVIDAKIALKLTELGSYHRLKSSRKEKF